ncbi:MAG: DUF2283 domain-containing protein [Candidatus Omnitrophica bacterium]|nr:DUF2283 domain-containing protein [Candidatus Omnitrophota bacterium]
MAKKIVKLWYDKEGDYLEVIFDKKIGFFRQTKNDSVMEKIDDKGRILGFSVMNISKLAKKPLEVALT